MKLLKPQQLTLLLITTVILAIVGWLLAEFTGLSQLSPTSALITGAIIGSLLGITLFQLLDGRPQNASSSNGGSSVSSGEKMTIFVGNLAFKANSDQLSDLFSQYGVVSHVRIMMDRVTRRPRGFGFVEMDGKGAKKAIQALDGSEFMGRPLRVNEGHERQPKATETEENQD